MSLRIPLTPDQTLQTEFHEIERRLRKLEKATGISATSTTIRVVSGGGGGGSTVDLQPITDRLDALELALETLATTTPDIETYNVVGSSSRKGLVPDPGTSEPPTGVAQHVLTEDAEWGFPLRGLVGVQTSGEQTDPPRDVVNINAALHAGHLSVSNIECFDFHTHGDIEYNDTFYDDLRVEPVARTTGANAPSFEKYFDDAPGTSRGVYLYSFDDAAGGSEKEIFFTMQMPHAWKEGTPIRLHVHWVGAVSDTTADPRWGLEYTFKNLGDTFADTTIVYSNGTHFPGSEDGTPDPDVTAGRHYLTPVVMITPDSTNNLLSSILIGRLFRDSANAGDTYNAVGAKVGLIYIDAHYEIDSPGSSALYVK